MKGCLKFFAFTIVVLFLLIVLIFSWPLALILAAIAVYFFFLRNSKEAKQPRTLSEKDKIQAIEVARSRPDLFKFDPKIKTEDLRTVKRFSNTVPWATSIQKRYLSAKTALEDASMVVNDDIKRLAAYREDLRKTIINNYETIIRPFKEDLQLMADDIPLPRQLKAAEKFTFPDELQPKIIQDDINRIASSASQNINSYISSRGGISAVGKSDFITVGIQVAISLILYDRTLSKQRRDLEQLQANVDTYCLQVSGAISTLGKTADEVHLLREQHKAAVQYMMEYYEVVKTIVRKHKNIDEVEAEKRKQLEAFYIGGKLLKRLMKVNIMNSSGK